MRNAVAWIVSLFALNGALAQASAPTERIRDDVIAIDGADLQVKSPRANPWRSSSRTITP